MNSQDFSTAERAIFQRKVHSRSSALVAKELEAKPEFIIFEDKIVFANEKVKSAQINF